jgi:hypothetical protein
VSALVRRHCGSAEEAHRLAAAVAADNPPHVRARAEGTVLMIRVSAASPASLRATLDDLLACVQAAERTGAHAARNGPRAGRDGG